MTTRHVLTLTCPDRPGIVHGVCSALLDVDANIVDNHQFGDADSGTFCMRTVFDAAAPDTAVADVVGTALTGFGGHHTLRRLDDRPKVMVMVSKYDHCLVDLIYRWETGALPVELSIVVSNHPDLGDLVRGHGIDFVHLPVTADTKAAQEAAVLDLVRERTIDLVVLARYMQILSDDLCTHLEGRAINIHHSFLPGFKGAKPYHQAHERGVKLVGATAHFVTADLDEGPIIEQDVARVTHAHRTDELVRLGQDIERMVLSRAVRWWAEDRVLRVGDRTVVFA